jgi:glycerophosphoryl diester phosphodiesterase
MPVEIIGHRGAAGVAPENTLPSFRRALADGLRQVELDVRLTLDGELVCFHDDRLDRVTPQRGRVTEWAWAALSAVPVLPGAFGGAYPDARIPLLSEVFAGLPEDCRYLVELKADPVRPAEVVERTLAVIAAAGAGDRCRLISFDADLLRLARGAGSEIPLGFIAGVRDRDTLLPVGKELGALALHLQHSAIDAQFLAAAQDAGFLLNCWTVNTVEEVRRLVGLGVHEITTDFPETALGAAAM